MNKISATFHANRLFHVQIITPTHDQVFLEKFFVTRSLAQKLVIPVFEMLTIEMLTCKARTNAEYNIFPDLLPPFAFFSMFQVPMRTWFIPFQ